MNDNIDAVNCAGSVRRYSAHSRLMRKIKGRSVRYGQPLRQRELGLLEHGVATSLAYKTCIRIGWGIGHWTLCCWTLCWSLCPFIHVHNLSPVYRAAWVDVELWWAMCQRYNWCNVVLKFVSACDRCATRNIWTLIHIVFVMIDCVPRLGHNYATINVGTQHNWCVPSCIFIVNYFVYVKPKQIMEIKDFLLTARRQDAKCKCAAYSCKMPTFVCYYD